VSTAEDTARAVSLVATDVDGDTLSYVVVSGPMHGALSGSGASLTYTPFANYNGPDSFTFKANDGQADSNVATVAITVTEVNDAPVNSVPLDTQTMAKNTNLIFSSGNGNAILIADVDAGSALIQVTLAVTDGTLTLSSTAGLTFSTGDGYADRRMTFTGTIEAINAALDGLRFTPRKKFTGTVILTLTTNDLGNSGSGGALSATDMVTIAVG
jgi:hypothetical protein